MRRATSSATSRFPKDFYSYFNRIGRPLEDGEQIEWTPDSATNKTVLTPVKRKRLVLAHRENYEADVNIVGLVEELDAKKKTGTLRDLDKEAINFVFDDPFFDDLREAPGNKAIHARVKGIGVFDVNDRLGSTIEIEQLECLAHYPVVAAIEQLSNLSAGWLEGVGIPPKPDDLNWLVNEVTKAFPESLAYPSVVPTEEGHVIFEWIRPQSRIELEFNFSDKKMEFYATDLAASTFEEAAYEFDQWEAAFQKVGALLGA